jgi:hypothetical protein
MTCLPGCGKTCQLVFVEAAGLTGAAGLGETVGRVRAELVAATVDPAKQPHSKMQTVNFTSSAICAN